MILETMKLIVCKTKMSTIISNSTLKVIIVEVGLCRIRVVGYSVTTVFKFLIIVISRRSSYFRVIVKLVMQIVIFSSSSVYVNL